MGEGLRHRSGGLAQPRWGCAWHRTLTQGSWCLATLGFGTMPRWGIQSADYVFEEDETEADVLVFRGVHDTVC